MKVAKTFRLSPEAAAILDSKDNATQYIEQLLLDAREPLTLSAIRTLLEEVLNFRKDDTIYIDPKDYIKPQPADLQTREEVKMNVLTLEDIQKKLGVSSTKPTPSHTCAITCRHWVWDTDKGGRINTYTGEFEEGEPF